MFFLAKPWPSVMAVRPMYATNADIMKGCASSVWAHKELIDWLLFVIWSDGMAMCE